MASERYEEILIIKNKNIGPVLQEEKNLVCES
jgi:hypothetical protein